MKKKLLGLLAIAILSFGVIDAANATSDQYKAALAPVRRAKNAQVRVINNQIDAIQAKIDAEAVNTTMSDTQRSKNLQKYQNEIFKLEQKKEQINAKYKADKKALKAKYR